jgi:hypothetical protein
LIDVIPRRERDYREREKERKRNKKEKEKFDTKKATRKCVKRRFKKDRRYFDGSRKRVVPTHI